MTQIVTVSSIAALQTAINQASTGDTIVLANGTYLNNSLTISTNNITVMSETAGGVYLNGSNAININANYITFSGFQFTSGSITGNAITINGNNNTLSQLNFNGYSASHMIIISGQYNVITYSNFQNKPALNMVSQGGTGDMIQIIPNSSIVGYNTIQYCSFQHMPGFGGDYGNECIRIGDSVYSTFTSGTIVEFCYFEDTGNGDSEAISVKSRGNCLRYNTMQNNPNAMFSFRNGDNNVAYSNFFFNSGGIRCKEANNIYCYNNYFQGAGRIKKSSPAIYFEYFGTGYGNNFNCIHNTFYKCVNTQIDTALTNCTWANNIFYSDSASIFVGSTNGQSFAGNIYQGTLGLTISTGMININPLLTLNADGYYGLTATSPAIAAASTNYPAILSLSGINNDQNLLLDIKENPRPSILTQKDIGCEQYTSSSGTNHPLALCDVGPSYLCSTNAAINESKKNADVMIYPNPCNGIINIKSINPISEIEIINIFGTSIYITTSISKSTINTIKLPNIPKGVYIVKLTDEKKKIENKEILIK